MDDNQLFELAENIDNFFNKTILEGELSVNGFNGVFMARMMRLNQACGNLENFHKLLRDIADGEPHAAHGPADTTREGCSAICVW